jgi:hypothetical protein
MPWFNLQPSIQIKLDPISNSKKKIGYFNQWDEWEVVLVWFWFSFCNRINQAMASYMVQTVFWRFALDEIALGCPVRISDVIALVGTSRFSMRDQSYSGEGILTERREILGHRVRSPRDGDTRVTKFWEPRDGGEAQSTVVCLEIIRQRMQDYNQLSCASGLLGSDLQRLQI